MDILKISLPEKQILKTLKFDKNNLAIIMDGKNIGQTGNIVEIKKRFGPNASTVLIEQNGDSTETLYDYTFIIGEKQSEISLPNK